MLCWPNISSYVDWKWCDSKLSRPYWSAMWIGNYVTGSYHDHFQVLLGLQQMIEDDVMTKFDVLCRLDQMRKNAVMT
jgi:hypothetical protein